MDLLNNSLLGCKKDDNMKTKFISILSLIAFCFGISSCHSPEAYSPTGENIGLQNLIVSFPNDDRDENEFTSEIDHTNHIATVVFPYNYPRLSDDILTADKLSKVRVRAKLANNAYILNGGVLWMDLTKENTISVQNPAGDVVEYTIKGEIRKSSECTITEYKLPTALGSGLTAIIKEVDKTITFLTFENIGKELAEVTISHGATLEPDPRTEALDYDSDLQITVIAQNGLDRKVYNIGKGTPEKIKAGMRPNSGKILWTKKLSDLGLTKANMQTGIAVNDNYVVINERSNSEAIYLNAKTGEKVGSMNISSFAGSTSNFYCTSDDAGNILFCNYAPNAGDEFIIYKANSVNEVPTPFIRYITSCQIGRKISVKGDVNGDALITAPYYTTAGQTAIWKVTGGVPAAAPSAFTAKITGSWGYNADIIMTSNTDIKANYFGAFYAVPRSICYFNGADGSVKSKGIDISPNWVQNAVDLKVFNNNTFVAHNSVNSFTWGEDDCVYLYDVSNGSFGDMAADFSKDGIGVNGKYGAKALGAVNGNGTGDIALWVSKDGYYMYLYFMFTGGYVGCVQFDCIKQ